MGIDSIVADKLLAHQPGKLRGASRVYQRHDFAAERADSLRAWAAHVLRRAESKLETSNVVELRAHRAKPRRLMCSLAA